MSAAWKLSLAATHPPTGRAWWNCLCGILACLVASIALTGLCVAADEASPPKFHVYFGTYTSGTSEGIYRSTFDSGSGSLGTPELVAKVKNPSFLALHPSKPMLYCVSEVAEPLPGGEGGQPTGAVVAFSKNARTGELKELGWKSSGGAGPCHLSIDLAGSAVFVANYGGGSVASLPLDAEGLPAKPVSIQVHEGSSINKQRQQQPHAHSINLDPSNRYAFAADLGCDKIFIYQFDPATRKLKPHDIPFAPVAAGSGPRHFAFHPTGRFAYVINELTSTVTAFKFDATKGDLEPIQTVSTLPKDASAAGNSTAEIVVHPAGGWLVGSNRSHDSLALFSIKPETGELTLTANVPAGGKTPRNFAFDPTGKWLIAAHQGSNSVQVFAFDATKGTLTPHGEPMAIGAPVCVRFSPIQAN